MVQLFRLRHFSLRRKISLFSILSLGIAIITLGISTGISLGAPLFSSPATAAQGRQLYEPDMHIRKDGLAFLVATSFNVNSANEHIRNWLSLTVLNNGTSYTDSVNVDQDANTTPVKYQAMAFSPTDGTGYVVWRTTKYVDNYEAVMRIIPPAYNGTTNKTLGAQIRLQDKTGWTLDQPAVAVDSAGYVYVTGYAYNTGQAVQLRMVKLDPANNYNVVGQPTILDEQLNGQRQEMDPIMCIDPANNIHVVSTFPVGSDPNNPSTMMVYSNVGGAGFVKTQLYPTVRELRGGRGKDMVCAPDGTVYVAVNNRGNNLYQFDLFKRTPGSGGSEKWVKTASNIFGNGADAVSVTVSTDGKLWVAQSDGLDSSLYGGNVKYSTDGGVTFSPNEQAIPTSQDSIISFIAIDGNGPGGKVHLIDSYEYDYSVYTTQYAYAITTPPPAAPTNLTASAVSPSQINLSWTASASSPDSYNIYRSNSASGQFSLIAQGVTGPAYNDTGLAPGTVYYYEVSAVKSNVEGPLSNVANATTLLGAPGNLGAVGIDSKTINLTWSASAPTPDGYNIYRSTDPNFPSGPATTVINVPNSPTSYSNTGLNYGTTYYYRITAVKSGFAESAPSNTAVGTTLAPYRIVFTTQPSSGVAGAVIGSQPAVKIVDVNGATVTNYTGNITLSITPNTGNPSAALGGTLTKSTNGGTATFEVDLTIDAVGLGYQLRATGSATGVYGDSAPFDQTGKIVFSSSPSSVKATDAFAIQVTMQKTGGATDTKFNGPISLTLTNPRGAYYYGMPVVNAASGVATFKYLMIDTVANGYTYTASTFNAALVAPNSNSISTSLDVTTYMPGTCTRILYTTTATATNDSCSRDTLQAALDASVAPNPNVPVFVDHRTTTGNVGLGSSQVSLSQTVTIPDGAILDGGSNPNTPQTPQGLLLDGINTTNHVLSIQGNNHYLRGIYFRGNRGGTSPLFSGNTGNIMSGDKVEVVVAG